MHETEMMRRNWWATRVFTKPARENMLSTGTEDALNIK